VGAPSILGRIKQYPQSILDLPGKRSFCGRPGLVSAIQMIKKTFEKKKRMLKKGGGRVKVF